MYDAVRYMCMARPVKSTKPDVYLMTVIDKEDDAEGAYRRMGRMMSERRCVIMHLKC